MIECLSRASDNWCGIAVSVASVSQLDLVTHVCFVLECELLHVWSSWFTSTLDRDRFFEGEEVL